MHSSPIISPGHLPLRETGVSVDPLAPQGVSYADIVITDIDGAGSAIDTVVSQTAVEALDKRWATSEGRADWLVPHPAVTVILAELRARGGGRVLDLGCRVDRHALLFAEHGFDVEAIDGSPAGLAVVRETATARGLSVRRRARRRRRPAVSR